jgi:hypothetical protein
MPGSPKVFLWSRIAGNAIDPGLVAATLRDDRHDRKKLPVAIASVAAVTGCELVGAVRPREVPRAYHNFGYNTQCRLWRRDGGSNSRLRTTSARLKFHGRGHRVVIGGP